MIGVTDVSGKNSILSRLLDRRYRIRPVFAVKAVFYAGVTFGQLFGGSYKRLFLRLLNQRINRLRLLIATIATVIVIVAVTVL